jgi:hypothetical protein
VEVRQGRGSGGLGIGNAEFTRNGTQSAASFRVLILTVDAVQPGLRTVRWIVELDATMFPIVCHFMFDDTIGVKRVVVGVWLGVNII